MPGTNTVGLIAYGAYIPRLRLSRKAIADANAWFNPAIKGLARGERAICNWDEDSLTMGVEAARDCLTPARLDDGAAAGGCRGDFRIDHACRSTTGRTPAFSPRR